MYFVHSILTIPKVMARCPYQIPYCRGEGEINQIDDNLVKCGETHSNICIHCTTKTSNFCGAKVSPGNVQRWEVGKRDGHEETENRRSEKYEGSWEAKCTRHVGCGRKRRGGGQI